MAKPYLGVEQDPELDIDSELAGPWADVARVRADLADLSDDSLLDLVRRGSVDAYAVLFERYRGPAHRLAVYYSNTADAKDIAAECFARVYAVLRRGDGPQTSFRAYLFTSVRHEAGRRAKMRKREILTDDIGTVDRAVPDGTGALEVFERDLVRKAFASLPRRWQTALWHLDVEGLRPREVAPLMGLTPNGVSALAYRARDGLRKAYLDEHVTTTGRWLASDCRGVRPGFVDLVRGSATERDAAAIAAHLAACAQCTSVHRELEELNSYLVAARAVDRWGRHLAGINRSHGVRAGSR